MKIYLVCIWQKSKIMINLSWLLVVWMKNCLRVIIELSKIYINNKIWLGPLVKHKLISKSYWMIKIDKILVGNMDTGVCT